MFLPINKTAIYFALAIVLGIILSSLYKWKYDDWIAIPKAREAMQAQLRDPESAEFRNERFTNSRTLCGEVNAKNGMGGYTGFERYFTTGAVSYLEKSGSLNKETHEEFMLRMDKKIALLKSYNQIQEAHPKITMPSESRIDEQAAEEVVRDKFREACGIDL
jgi:hypothetical protein